MTKKDVLIFLNIFMLALRGSVDKEIIEDFRDEIYLALKENTCYSDVLDYLLGHRLFSKNPFIYANFIDYLDKVKKMIY